MKKHINGTTLLGISLSLSCFINVILLFFYKNACTSEALRQLDWNLITNIIAVLSLVGLFIGICVQVRQHYINSKQLTAIGYLEINKILTESKDDFERIGAFLANSAFQTPIKKKDIQICENILLKILNLKTIYLGITNDDLFKIHKLNIACLAAVMLVQNELNQTYNYQDVSIKEFLNAFYKFLYEQDDEIKSILDDSYKMQPATEINNPLYF